MKLIVIMSILAYSVGASGAPNKVDEFFKNKTKIERPFELRDPFRAPVQKKDKEAKERGFYTEKGVYTNIKETEVSDIEQIKLVGVLVGKERRAMIDMGQAGIITLKEGQKVGESGAELKAILPGGIIIVEKMVNVYGQEEYLETVIPISK